MKVFLSMLYILAVLFSGTSSASGEDKSEYDGLNEYCRGVAASLTVLAGLTPSTLLSRTIMLTVSGASEYMADELMSTKWVVFRILCHFVKLSKKEMTYDQNQFRHGCRLKAVA